jgi:Type II CAAX prenyl endopeptidase Rce1-like
VLMAASLLASLASIPFAVRIGTQPANRNPSLSGKAFWSIVICFEAATSALAIATGLWLGNRLGLGAPLVLHVLARDPSALRELQEGIPFAIAVGFSTGAVIVALRLALRRLTPMPSQSAAADVMVWERLLAAFAAGIREELWFRFGLMTCLLWGATQILQTTSNNAAVLWGTNLLIALGFGTAHLGQARVLHGLTTSYVAYILLLNGVASLAFGWIYCRQGLFAAVAAHCCTDLVLQILLPRIEPHIGRQGPPNPAPK